MSPTFVTTIIALITQILPVINSASQVGSIIVTLIQLLPTIVKEVQDLVQPVKNIIAALQENPAATDQLIADLKALDAKVDADFEAAAATVEADDAAL